MFVTNQKVVCINADFDGWVKNFYTALPEKDKVYVVRGMAPAINERLEDEGVCVYLVGLQNPCSNKPPHRERGFKVDRFRPLDELTSEEILSLTKTADLSA